LKVVLGLGNDGPEYRLTRHNVGFMVVDLLAERAGAAFTRRGDLGRLAWLAVAEVGGEGCVLAKPRTLMNASGRAAAALQRKYGTPPSSLIAVFDDADLALGRVRVRPDGGAGGHNGVRSLIEVMGTPSFSRVKLGVRGDTRDASNLADYVLRPFLPGEREEVSRMVSAGADAVEAVVREGIEAARRAFNGPLP
jgi:peptidyl-tRNA hydrolase, PTH1 family